MNPKAPDERTTLTAEETRYFELPFSAAPGRLLNPALGLCSVVQRAGEHKPYEMIVTVLDTPDHRLVRSGVWLAHRVIAERGEWYLAAPDWAPWLPAEEIEPMGGDGDLPDRFAELVLPFRRGAALGPVAALTARREEYALRGPEAEILGVLRSEQVTVRSGGLTTARYREVTVTPAAGGLTPAQLSWISEALNMVGGLRVAAFPSTAQRLGTPATGLTDLPLPPKLGRGDSLEAYAGAQLARHVRTLTTSDVALRAVAYADRQEGGKDKASREKRRAAAELADALLATQTMLRGFLPLWQASWFEELDEDLTWVIDVVRADKGAALPPQLSGSRYLGVLDRLVTATRAPRLDEHALEPCGPVLDNLLARHVNEFRVRARALNDHSSDESWLRTLAAAHGVLDCCVVQPEQTKALKRLQRWTRRFADDLALCSDAELPRLVAEADTLTATEAFAAGRRYEQRWAAQQTARNEFRQQWQRRGSRVQLPPQK